METELKQLVGKFVKVFSAGGHMFVKGTLCEAMIDPEMFSVYVDREMAGVCFGVKNVRQIRQGYSEMEIQLKTSM